MINKCHSAVLLIASCVWVPFICVANDEPVKPIPLTNQVDKRKAKLGEKLFADVRLSKGNKLACVSCHQLSQGGDDGLPVSRTNTGLPDQTNAPTVFNSKYNFRYTWRGEFKTLEQQAKADIKNPRHGNLSMTEVLAKLARTEYPTLFDKAYPDGMTEKNVLNAIAEYQRSLTTPDARFDQYLRGNSKAITAREKEGYLLFKSYGCIACHQGINVGGNMSQKFGVMREFFDKGREIKPADLGRFKFTKQESDKFVFRVPSLRNVAVTAPYFHDGSAETLIEAIKVMANVQLGLEIKTDDAEKIKEFLETLTGKYKGVHLVDKK